MSETVAIAISALISVTAAILGWRAVHRRNTKGYWIALAVAVATSGYLYLAALSANGWDGITYLILMICGSLPVTATLLIGGGVGLVTRQRLQLPS